MNDLPRVAPSLLYRPSTTHKLVELAIVRGSAVALPVHFHDEDQLTLVLSGRRRFLIRGALVEVEPGGSAFIAAGTPHSSLDEPDGVVCLNAYLPAGAGIAGERIREVAREADAAGMSREGSSRAFRRNHGIAPSVCRSLVRLNRARRLLRAGVPLAAVAAEAGFSDQSHLGRCFRHAFGVTPGRYRAAWSHPFQTAPAYGL